MTKLVTMTYTIYKNPDFFTYQVGDIVEKTDFYICVPCGYKKYLQKGEKKMLTQGLELWERAYQN